MKVICVKHNLFKHNFLLYLGLLDILESLLRVLELPTLFYPIGKKYIKEKGNLFCYTLEKLWIYRIFRINNSEYTFKNEL